MLFLSNIEGVISLKSDSKLNTLKNFSSFNWMFVKRKTTFISSRRGLYLAQQSSSSIRNASHHKTYTLNRITLRSSLHLRKNSSLQSRSFCSNKKKTRTIFEHPPPWKPQNSSTTINTQNAKLRAEGWTVDEDIPKRREVIVQEEDNDEDYVQDKSQHWVLNPLNPRKVPPHQEEEDAELEEEEDDDEGPAWEEDVLEVARVGVHSCF
jgi:hypothetical protein